MRRLHFFSLIAAITALGAVLRLSNLSPYLVYPDSYTSLVVSDHIARTGQAVAALGSGGLTYPGFFGWTRPIYPLFIALLNMSGISLDQAGRVVALFAGILSIPAAAWLGYEFRRRRSHALAAAGLMSISFAGVVWSGFVFTETLGNLTLLLLLAYTLRLRHRPVQLLDPADYLAGLLLAIAILTRYEYALLIPVILLLSASKLTPGWRWLNISAATALLLGLAAIFVRPTNFDLLATFRGFLPFQTSTASDPTISGYPALVGFSLHDPLIVIAALLGLVFLFFNLAHRRLAWLTIASLLLLGAAYYKTNPTMDRYIAHFLPLLLIPAAAALVAAWNMRSRWRLPALALLAGAGIFQTAISYQALRPDQAGLWYKLGYEQIAAQQSAPSIPQNAVIFTAFPEPYYLATHNPTQSFTSAHPYTYAPGLTPDTPVVVVIDEPLKEVFPAVYSRLAANPPGELFDLLPAEEPLRYRTQIIGKPIPTQLYRTTYGQLQSVLSANAAAKNR